MSPKKIQYDDKNTSPCKSDDSESGYSSTNSFDENPKVEALVMDQQEPFCVCIYYCIMEFRWGGTTMTQIIVGLTYQVLGGLIQMYWLKQSEGPCLGGGGYRNDANYCGIDRPGCDGGGFV